MLENEQYVFLLDKYDTNHFIAHLKDNKTLQYSYMLPIYKYSSSLRGDLVFSGTKKDILRIEPVV